MASKRKAVEELILNVISRISAHKENVQMYKEKFASMNDAQFKQFIDDLDTKKIRLSIVEPNFTDREDVPNEEVMKVGEELGYEWMQNLWIEGKDGLPAYPTPVKYAVFLTTARRPSQSLTKKISVPPHNRVRDLLTGQVTGESKGASVSSPELQLVTGMGADQSAKEMFKPRGGDSKGGAALAALLSKTGRASLQVVDQFSSGVQVTAALRTFLTAAMHRVNL